MSLATYQQEAKAAETQTELGQLLDRAISDREITPYQYRELLEIVWARVEQLARPAEVAA